MKYIFLAFILTVSLGAKAQHPPVFDGMTTDTAYIVLGDLDINLVKYSYDEPGIAFLTIHDDEDTGVKAAFQYISKNGGSIIDCQYGGVRNFKFLYEEEPYQLDPNSIYTKKGVKLGLEKYGNSDHTVIQELEKAGTVILNHYNPKKLGYLFTLHNNGDGGFGIQSYLKGYELEAAADSVNINFALDPDDMVLVTELPLFNLLKKENVNVVLQSKDAPDDGSLSVYAMQNKIPYINVEVQHGHIDEHLNLIATCTRILAETYNLKKPAD
jgi:hypothetical protein